MEERKSTFELVGFQNFPGSACVWPGVKNVEFWRQHGSPAPGSPSPSETSKEHLGSPGAPGVALDPSGGGEELWTHLKAVLLGDSSPGPLPSLPILAPDLEAQAPHGLTSFTINARLLVNCVSSWPFICATMMSPPSLDTFSASDRAPPRGRPGAASCLCSGVLLQNVPSIFKCIPRESPWKSDLSVAELCDFHLHLSQFSSLHSRMCFCTPSGL